MSCADVGDDDDTLPSAEEVVEGYGVLDQALVTSSLLSVNGTYGASCAGRSGAWSLAVSQGAPLDNASLTVATGNTACQLTLTGLRTGTGVSNLFVASPSILMTASYAASASSFSASGNAQTFTANAKLSAVSFSAAFVVSVLHADDPALVTGSKQALYPYDVTIQNTANLLSYWRLGESGVFVSDAFTGTSNSKLETRAGAVGSTWTRHADSSSGDYAFISNAGRARTDNDAPVMYYTSGVPASADYSVEATVRPLSLLRYDQASVLGRTTSASNSYYAAGYVITDHVGAWELRRGSTIVASYAQTLTAAVDYYVTLELRGTRVRVLVSGVEVIAYTDASSLSSVGRAGLSLGKSGVTSNPSDSDGLHLDDLTATPLADDAKGTNDGVYVRGVSFGTAGALSSGSNTAVTFDGSNDYLEVDRTVSDDFSVELWFKSTQGIGTGSQWYSGAGLLDADVAGTANDFGLSLRSDGRVTAGVGNPDTTVVSTSSGFNNGQWHHVVFTRTKATGALALYIDGQAQGTGTGGTQSLTAASRMDVGRIRTGTNYFAGSIDEVSVYSAALSAATALRHYQAGRP